MKVDHRSRVKELDIDFYNNKAVCLFIDDEKGNHNWIRKYCLESNWIGERGDNEFAWSKVWVDHVGVEVDMRDVRSCGRKY